MTLSDQMSNEACLAHDLPNPKLEPQPSSNTEKVPDDGVSGDEPMTGAQASYLIPFARRPKSTRPFKTSPRLRPPNGLTN